MTRGHHALETAERIAEEVLAPAAAEVEKEREIPAGHWQALADAGLYGASAPRELGGAGAAPTELWMSVEILAAGCLATTFVLIQHFGLLRSLIEPTAPPAMRDQHLQALIQGRRRAGIALGGLLADGSVRAARSGDGWLLSGVSPWVTGWGYLDLLQVAARTADDRIGLFLLEAGHPELRATPVHLTAVDASRTVRLAFPDVRVPSEQLIGLRPYDPTAAQNEGLRTNGSLALGLVRRADGLLGGSLAQDLAEARRRLDEAGVADMPAARAAASLLALRAAARVGVEIGSASVSAGSDADRLAREALFTLVFGSRPAIKEALRRRLVR
jgi:alkylation response protein AidB-like acyl-CoA dehydrogenase